MAHLRTNTLAASETASCEYKNGEAFFKVPIGDKPSEGYDPKFLGSYLKENGPWVLKTISTNAFILKATLLSIQISDPHAKPDSIYRNLVRPRMMF
jgi:hypothetical protein